MQPNFKLKKALCNVSSDTPGNFISDNSMMPGYILLFNGDAATVIAPPIPCGSIISVEHQHGQQEKLQHVLIAGTDETIVANTRYTVGIEFPKDRVSGSGTRDKKIFAYQMGTLASAAADRATVYTALYNKINAYVGMYSKAKLAFLMNMTGDIGEALTVGQLVFEKSGTWVGYVLKAITLVDGNAASVLVCTLSGTPPTAGEGIVIQKTSNAGTDVLDGTLSYTAAQGLVIYDEGGYFSWKEKLGRGGAPFIMSSTTFLSQRPTIIQAHQYSYGWANDMLLTTPEFDLTRQNVDRGNIESQYTTLPTANASYTKYTITYLSESAPNALDGSISKIPAQVELYWKDTTAATAYAAGSNSNTTVHGILIGLT